MTRTRLLYLAALAASVLLLVLSVQPVFAAGLTPLESVAVVSYAWSTWLLAKNRPLGWWVGIVSIVAYAVLFYRGRLFAEAGIQVFYLASSLHGIYLWLRGGTGHTARPVGRLPRRWLVASLALAVPATFGLWQGLLAVRGAAPFWDALTTVFSLVAQLFLMGRYVESWYLWIAIDLIFIPLYASRGFYLTSALYVVVLYLAFVGLGTFRRALAEREGAAPPEPGT